MHEFSISSEIVRTVLDATEKNNGKKVLSVQLEIGESTLLNVEQITFWMEELFKGSFAEGAKVKIKVIKTNIHCKSCGYKGRPILNQKNLIKHFFPLSCPKCGSIQIKVEKGKECTLKRIQAAR